MNFPRIAIFTRPIDNNIHSGSGQYAYELYRALLSQQHGLDITLVHHRTSTNPLYKQARELIIPRNPFTASAILRRRNFHLVHYYLPTIYTPVWGVPSTTVVTIYGAEPALIPRYYPTHHVFHDRYITPFITRRINHIIGMSHTTISYIQNRYSLQAHQSLTYIPAGVASIYKPPQETSLPQTKRTAAQFGIDTPFFFHVSRYSLRKNPWTILRGFQLFLNRVQNTKHAWKLLIAGKGWNNHAVLDFIARSGLQHAVVIGGFIAEEWLPRLYAEAQAFLFPSLCEGFGMPNLEAMACGCPVITSDAFAIPEVVGNAGIIISPPKNASALADAMVSMAANPKERERRSKAGLTIAARYTWADSAKRLADLYHNLLL